MKFNDYYKNKKVVDSYEDRRSKGIKARVVRYLERYSVSSLLGSYKGKILEAGVGTGFITEVLRKHGQVEGFDISEEMIKKTRKKFPDIPIRKADILKIDIKKRYGAIVSVRVISHFKPNEAERALTNLGKGLEKEGFIIFNLENRSATRRIMRKILKWGSTETYQYSGRDTRDLAEAAGLRIVDFACIDHMFLLPLHALNKILLNKLEPVIKRIEVRLVKVRFASNNTFLKCQK